MYGLTIIHDNSIAQHGHVPFPHTVMRSSAGLLKKKHQKAKAKTSILLVLQTMKAMSSFAIRTIRFRDNQASNGV